MKINHNCTTAKMAEQLDIPLWKVMELGKYFEKRFKRKMPPNPKFWTNMSKGLRNYHEGKRDYRAEILKRLGGGMKIILALLVILITFTLAVVAYDENGICQWIGSCDSCCGHIEAFKVGEYILCSECFDAYKIRKEIRLHPSRYCGVYCAHSHLWNEKRECPLLNEPNWIINGEGIKK